MHLPVVTILVTGCPSKQQTFPVLTSDCFPALKAILRTFILILIYIISNNNVTPAHPRPKLPGVEFKPKHGRIRLQRKEIEGTPACKLAVTQHQVLYPDVASTQPDMFTGLKGPACFFTSWQTREATNSQRACKDNAISYTMGKNSFFSMT